MGNAKHILPGMLAPAGTPLPPGYQDIISQMPKVNVPSLGLTPEAPLEAIAGAFSKGMKAAPDRAQFILDHTMPEAIKYKQLVSTMSPSQVSDFHTTQGTPTYDQIMNAPVPTEMKKNLLNQNMYLLQKQNASASLKTGGFAAPSEYRAAQDMINMNQSPAEQLQSDNNARLAEMIDAYKSAPRQGLDWKAGASTINSLFGSKLDASGAPPVETQQDRDRTMIGLRDKLNSNYEQQAQRNIATLNALKMQPNVYNFGSGAEVKPVLPRQATPLNPQKEVADYTNNLAKDKVPDLYTMMGDIESKIPKTGDFAGAGPLTNAIAKIPYVGTALLPDKAKEFRLSLVALQNALANKLFGSRQTESEIARLDKQMATGAGYTADDMRKAIANIRGQLNAEIQNRHNALSPEAKQLYGKLPGAIAPGSKKEDFGANVPATPLKAGGGFMEKLRLP